MAVVQLCNDGAQEDIEAVESPVGGVAVIPEGTSTVIKAAGSPVKGMLAAPRDTNMPSTPRHKAAAKPCKISAAEQVIIISQYLVSSQCL